MALKIVPLIVSVVIMTIPIPSETSLLDGKAVFSNLMAHVAFASRGDDVSATSTSALANVNLRKMWVTAYSSTPEETDDTPFITASNTQVRDGIVATNMLPFGTKIMIPKLFGKKIFVVEDRMHPRKVNFLDVWTSSRQEALKIGINFIDVVVLD